MLEPALVEAASLPPGHCRLCGKVDGPMVDTQIETLMPAGRVYFCPGCVTVLARTIGSVTSEEALAVDEALAEAEQRIEELEQELATERDRKLVSIGELRAMLAADTEPAVEQPPIRQDQVARAVDHAAYLSER